MYNLNYTQQLWGYKVEKKLYLGVREQKRLNTTGLENVGASVPHNLMGPTVYYRDSFTVLFIYLCIYVFMVYSTALLIAES
jgi:hypothetical protein